MITHKFKKWALFFPVIGSSIFFIFTIIAMIVFGGGNWVDFDEPGYSFINNYFSDLGMLVAYNGVDNTISSVLFTISTLSIGIAMIPYFIVIPFIFKENILNFLVMVLGSFLGIIAAVSYIGIGFTPWDKSEMILELHTLFVYLAFPLTLPVIMFYLIAFFRNKSFPKYLAYVYIVLGLILAAYLYLLFWGPSSDTPMGNMFQVGGQKVIVYAEIITFWIQGYGTSRHFKTLLTN